jgi:short-subunit dehydrogenase
MLTDYLYYFITLLLNELFIMKEFKDKNCFITGAASGIGRSFALALAKEGMNLFITDIDLTNLEKVKKEIEELNVKVYADKCDVSSYQDFQNAAENFYTKFGELDLLINNAGIAIGGSAIELELEDWKKVLDINLWSIIHSLKVFLPIMLEKGSGHIVNVASAAGVLGATEPLPYVTSKFAVVGLSEALFCQINRLGIDVSIVLPSYIRTNIFENAEVKYPKSIVERVDKQVLEEIRQNTVKEFYSTSSSPDRVVKKYLRGIKKNQLYIFDAAWIAPLLISKVQTPQNYETMLKNLSINSFNQMKDNFSKLGLNIDDYL